MDFALVYWKTNPQWGPGFRKKIKEPFKGKNIAIHQKISFRGREPWRLSQDADRSVSIRVSPVLTEASVIPAQNKSFTFCEAFFVCYGFSAGQTTFAYKYLYKQSSIVW